MSQQYTQNTAINFGKLRKCKALKIKGGLYSLNSLNEIQAQQQQQIHN